MKIIRLICVVFTSLFAVAAFAQKEATPQVDPIIGTWRYSSAVLSEESVDHIQKQLNSPERLEKKMTSSLIKIGFKAGSSLIFNDDGTFTQRVNGKNFEGTYTCSPDHKNLTLTFNTTKEQAVMSLDFKDTYFTGTLLADQFMSLVNVNDSKSNSETKLFILCLITQFEDTKIVVKYTKTK